MKISLIVIGKTEESWLRDGWSVYAERLKHYCNFELIEIPVVKNAKNMNVEQLKTTEGKLLLHHVPGTVKLVLLDENGKQLTSAELAEWNRKQMNAGVRHVVFAVGGAFGFSKEVHDRANEKISLSKMTFSHQMVRVFFAEQLYRSFTILKGEKYHHA